jgi:hypothetical protein
MDIDDLKKEFRRKRKKAPYYKYLDAIIIHKEDDIQANINNAAYLQQGRSASFVETLQEYHDALSNFLDEKNQISSLFDLEIGRLLDALERLIIAITNRKQIPTEERDKFFKIREFLYYVEMKGNQIREEDSYRDYYRLLAKEGRDKLEYLLQSKNWIDKVSDGQEIFSVGLFEVHNDASLVGRKLKDIHEKIQISNDLVRLSEIPKVKQILYGDIFLTQKITGGERAAAVYHRDLDAITIDVSNRSMSFYTDDASTPRNTFVHSVVHELGHRYYKKVLSRNQRNSWIKLWEQIRKKPVLWAMPQVGYVFDKNTLIEGKYSIGGRQLVKIEDNIYVLDDGHRMTEATVRKYMQDEGKQARYSTWYGQTKAEEEFCESFALLVLDRLKETRRRPFCDFLFQKISEM